jgi:hypothetical protein
MRAEREGIAEVSARAGSSSSSSSDGASSSSSSGSSSSNNNNQQPSTSSPLEKSIRQSTTSATVKAEAETQTMTEEEKNKKSVVNQIEETAKNIIKSDCCGVSESGESGKTAEDGEETCNPMVSDVEDLDENEDALRGDRIGGTTYSERHVLKILMKWVQVIIINIIITFLICIYLFIYLYF